MVARLAIHVLDDDHGRRAQIARCVFALGHHAEVYSDAEELAAHAPNGGVIVALEDVLCGGAPGLMGVLSREGRWFAVIASSPTPTIAKAVEAMKQGALDYLPLPCDELHLSRVLEAAAVKAEAMRARNLQQIETRARASRLSARESEVVTHMTKGLTNKEIGRTLGISPRTVEIHRNNALTKLGARNAPDAVRLWLVASGELLEM